MRNIVLANPKVVQCITDFRVEWDTEFATHATLRIVFERGQSDDMELRNHSTMDFDELFDKKVKELADKGE